MTGARVRIMARVKCSIEVRQIDKSDTYHVTKSERHSIITIEVVRDPLWEGW